MNSQQESRMSLLRRGYWQELETGDSSMFLYSPINKVIEAKTIDEKLTALEYLLTSIVRGKQGNTDYYYNKDNY